MDETKKQPDKKQEDQAGWNYKPESVAAKTPADPADATQSKSKGPADGSVEWSASEFIHHDKGFLWYASFVLLIGLVIAGVYWLTHDIFSVIGIACLAIILGVVTSRKPRVLDYRLDHTGVTVGQTFYPYAAYKSFAVVEEGPFTSVVFVPMKRLALPLNLYLAPEDEEKAVEVLGRYLPIQRGELSGFDHLMRHARF